MKTFSIFEAAFELKDKLSPHREDSSKMLEAFNGYMEEKHSAVPGSMEYVDLVDIFTKKAGMRGYFEFMGVKK